MKRYISVMLICLVAWLAAAKVRAQNTSSDEFAKIKKLEGDWKATRPDGKAVEVSYKVMSNGSALVETLKPADEPSMVTVYHLDGDRLMMTHYCSAGNQPRMVASAKSDAEIDFSFLDATSLKSKSEGHMKGLKVIFVDDNHFNQIWTWSKSEEEMPSTFKFERVM